LLVVEPISYAVVVVTSITVVVVVFITLVVAEPRDVVVVASIAIIIVVVVVEVSCTSLFPCVCIVVVGALETTVEDVEVSALLFPNVTRAVYPIKRSTSCGLPVWAPEPAGTVSFIVYNPAGRQLTYIAPSESETTLL